MLTPVQQVRIGCFQQIFSALIVNMSISVASPSSSGLHNLFYVLIVGILWVVLFSLVGYVFC